MNKKSGFTSEKELAFYSRPQKQPSESIELLIKERGSGKPQPEKPTALPINQIKMARGVFQPRQIEQNIGGGEQHIDALMRTIRGKKDHQLDPVTIWWGGCFWYVIDGHHRLQAYERLARGVGTNKPIKVDINVEVFEGELIDAVAYARQANAIDKRPTTTAEKTEGAWRLVVLSEMNKQNGEKSLSKAEINQATTVSTATIAIMRKKLGELLDAGMTPEMLLDRPWSKVRSNTEAMTEDQAEEAHRQRVERAAKQLAKMFGPATYKRPDLIAEALVQVRRDLPSVFDEVEAWVSAKELALFSDEEVDI